MLLESSISPKPAVRNPAEVLASLKALVPEPEVELHTEMDRLRERMAYSPPEYAHDMWDALSKFVTKTAGEPPLVPGWRLQMVARLMNISDERAQEMFTEVPEAG